jgi:hypothetical protein
MPVQQSESHIHQPCPEILYWVEKSSNITCGWSKKECMDQSCKLHVVKTDTLVFRTYLNSILPQVVNLILHQEMPSKPWLEWSGP